MTPERWQQVKQLFQSVVERKASQRDEFLDDACARDSSLRREVEVLLASDKRAASFLEVPPAKLQIDSTMDSRVAGRIGSYQIVREIGRGGMGTIYLAERADDEYRKQVAIKIVTRGMDTEAVLRRFRNERQILADLDHPHIAKLLDGGTTREGLSYFVIDYVDGLPIDQYCDAHKLPTCERLKLFRTVCSAVDYAHRRGVIHCDLKPSNILVTAEGVPRLLDFGIARVLSPELSTQTIKTNPELRPMTPEYASPEQVRGDSITPASDVYMLGVLLYGLLTGHRPYRVEGYTRLEIEQAVCCVEPESPSTVISRVEETANVLGETPLKITPQMVSEKRDGNPAKLRRSLAGDVDKIVLTALRKEAVRRYATVEEMSEDILRHLAGLPVRARRDTLWYRSGKLIKRNKGAVIAALLTAMTFVAMILLRTPLLGPRDRGVGSAISSVAVLPLENLSRNLEHEYLADGITEALITALAKIKALRVISRSSVISYQHGRKPLPEIRRELNVDAVISGAVLRSGERLQVTVHLVDAATGRHLWGERYQRDLRDAMLLQNEMAQAIAREVSSTFTEQERGLLSKTRAVDSEVYVAYLKGRYHWNKRTQEGYQKAIEHFQEAIANAPTYAPAYAGLADSYLLLGPFDARPSEETRSKARAATLKALEMDDTLAEAHASLGYIKQHVDWDWSGAESEYQRAIVLNPGYATARQWYGLLLASLGRHEEGIAETKQALNYDPLSLTVNTALGRQFYWARQSDQAIEQYLKTLDIDPNFWRAHSDLGQAYAEKSLYDEAIAEFKKATVLGAAPIAHAYLGHAYAMSGRRAEALKILDKLRSRSPKPGPDVSYSIAVLYTGLGERDQAMDWLEKAYEERAGRLARLRMEPLFDPLRSEPRFADLLRRIGF